MEQFKINNEKGTVTLSINPKLYSMDVVYSASYVFTENCYVMLDGDPNHEIIVELKPKSNDTELAKTAMEFSNELINYASYEAQCRRNSKLREILMHRILLTNNQALSNAREEESSSRSTDYLEKEAKPWDKKSQNEDGKNKNTKDEEPSKTFV